MILILLTFLAGILTILSPCILPVLPFVFSKGRGSFLKNTLPLFLGMSLTFSLFSALAVAGGSLVTHLSHWGRVLSLIFLFFLGISLIFKEPFERLVSPLVNWGNKLGTSSSQNGVLGSLFVGVSTGFLWAPCAGPILGLVLTGAASQKDTLSSLILLFSYSLGASTSLGLALFFGNKVFSYLKKFLKYEHIVRKILGLAVIFGVVVIALDLDKTLLTQISKVETASIEKKLLELKEKPKPKTFEIWGEGEMPDLIGVNDWLNSSPLRKKNLLGKVVLIDFWTYSCINCLRTLPYVKAWYKKYKENGFVVIGVHTPEFPFERNVENVKRALGELGIEYPVAIDNDYKVWNAFNNEYWPAHYFIDRNGRIRHHHFGEGSYKESEKVIQELLKEGEGGNNYFGQKISVDSTIEDAHLLQKGIQAPASQRSKISPETYIGYERAENFVSQPEIVFDKITNYTLNNNLLVNQWGLRGSWRVGEQSAVLAKAPGKIIYRFLGRDLHLVLGGSRTKFKVTIDGQAPLENHGLDIDPQGRGEVTSYRLYQLIRWGSDNLPGKIFKKKAKNNSKNSGERKEDQEGHLFEIEFEKPGVEVYAFTFG